jgi:Beta/Gamma crystallin
VDLGDPERCSTMAGADKEIPEVILFKDSHFRGVHKHIFGEVKNLDAGADAFTETSSMVVRGHWRISESPDHAGVSKVVPPKAYPLVTDAGLTNDQISSLKPLLPAEVASLSSTTPSPP